MIKHSIAINIICTFDIKYQLKYMFNIVAYIFLIKQIQVTIISFLSKKCVLTYLFSWLQDIKFLQSPESFFYSG